MERVDWIHASLLGVLGASFGLGACFLNSAGKCEENGRCVSGTETELTGPDVVPDDDGSTSEVSPECAGDAECDDGNLCTTDTCASGSCVVTALADGEIVGQESCQETTCEGGSETAVPFVATKLCEGYKVCDGAGNCTGCDADHTCPDGYECTGESLCRVALGSFCAVDGECASGHCVDNVCCEVACNDVCNSCSSSANYETCTYTTQYENHNDCPSGQACNGQGKCARLNGESCTAHDQCASYNCSGGTCTPP
jgi:hypothetical protein